MHIRTRSPNFSPCVGYYIGFYNSPYHRSIEIATALRMLTTGQLSKLVGCTLFALRKLLTDPLAMSGRMMYGEWSGVSKHTPRRPRT